MKIKILRDTGCETIDGTVVDVKKDDVIDATERAAERLIEIGAAVAATEPALAGKDKGKSK